MQASSLLSLNLLCHVPELIEAEHLVSIPVMHCQQACCNLHTSLHERSICAWQRACIMPAAAPLAGGHCQGTGQPRF